MKGLTLYVYRNPLFASCGDTPEHITKVTLVGIVRYIDRLPSAERPEIEPLPRDCQLHTPTYLAPPVVLVARRMGDRIIWHVQPLPETGWPVYVDGGSFVASSDSRLAELIDRAFYGAFAFHDRRR
jgi:hypothetical protein